MIASHNKKIKQPITPPNVLVIRSIVENPPNAVKIWEISKINDNPKDIRFMDILILSLFYIYDCGRVYKVHTNKYGTEYYKTSKTYKNKKWQKL